MDMASITWDMLFLELVGRPTNPSGGILDVLGAWNFLGGIHLMQLYIL